MNEDVTAEQFASFFSVAVDILGLKDSEIADMFSASRPTAERWKCGKSVPSAFLRTLVVMRLASEIAIRFEPVMPMILKDTDGFCAEPIDTEILQAILKW